MGIKNVIRYLKKTTTMNLENKTMAKAFAGHRHQTKSRPYDQREGRRLLSTDTTEEQSRGCMLLVEEDA